MWNMLTIESNVSIFSISGNAANDTTTPTLLVLYEFEAKSRLASPELEKVLDKALQLPQSEPKVFETLAGESIKY